MGDACMHAWRNNAYLINLGLSGKMGGNALGGFAHGPAGLIVTSQLLIQRHPIPDAAQN